MAEWLARDPAGFRAALEGGASFPADDKLAQLARGFWSHGRHVEVGDGRPVLDRRSSCSGPSRRRAARSSRRTIVSLGRGASASVVEELAPAGPDADCAEREPRRPRASSTARRRSSSARARRSPTPRSRSSARRPIAFQHRHARLGEGASMQWALAQLGGRLVRVAGRQPARGRPQHGRPGRDRVRGRASSSST